MANRRQTGLQVAQIEKAAGFVGNTITHVFTKSFLICCWCGARKIVGTVFYDISQEYLMTRTTYSLSQLQEISRADFEIWSFGVFE